MWQRIQTLYLAAATALIVSLFFSNLATVIGNNGEVVNEIRYYEKIPYLILSIMVFTANVSALVSFKARILQMRVAVIAAIMLTGFQVWIGADFIRHREEMIFSITAVFPIVAAILDFLAARNIALDEAMVQSAQRLRRSKRKK